MGTNPEPRIIELPRIYDPRGSLTFTQNGDGLLPFTIQRVFWTYDVPGGESRGGHAHHQEQQFIIAVSGSFDVNVFNGREWTCFHLNRPFQGLYLPPGYWRTLDNFSSGSVLLTLSSMLYTPEDYIEDLDDYIAGLTQAQK